MPSPSQAQLNSNAEPTGLLNSDVIAHHPSASDHSDIISDPVELERQLAQEGFHEKLDANEQATDGSREATISYEKALERELEYQKRLKTTLLRHPVRSTLLPTPSQPATTETPDPSLPPEQHLQSWQPSLQQLPDRRSPLQQPQPQRRKPLPQGSNTRRPLPGRQQGHPPPLLPPQQHNQQPPTYQIPLWCHLCKVKCTSLRNLRAHCQGKKHQATWDRVFGSKAAASTSSNGSAAP